MVICVRTCVCFCVQKVPILSDNPANYRALSHLCLKYSQPSTPPPTPWQQDSMATAGKPWKQPLTLLAVEDAGSRGLNQKT